MSKDLVCGELETHCSEKMVFFLIFTPGSKFLNRQPVQRTNQNFELQSK